MKAHKFLILSLLLSAFTCKFSFSQQSGWFWANPLPQGNGLSNAYFLNSQTGYMIGLNGTILMTTDGGIKWIIQYCDNTYSMLNRVYFLNVNTGYIAGYQGRILKTTNSGNNWQNVSGNSTAGFRDIRFFNVNTGLALAAGSTGIGGYVSRTVDGGLNWTDIPCGVTNVLFSMSFKDELTGIACGENGTIVRTTNGGLNWSSVSSGSSVFLYGIQMLNNGFSYCVGVNGIMLKSTNSGASWNNFPSGINIDLYNLCFINVDTGVVCGYGNTIYTTYNGGSNWSAFTVDQGSVFGIIYDGVGSFYSAGALGDMNKSTDMGISWFPLSQGDRNSINAVVFLDTLFGAVAGGPEGYVAITEDGGTSWRASRLGINVTNFYDVDFINENTGIVVGIYDLFGPEIIAKTTNKGLVWNEQSIPSLRLLTSVKFINNSTVIAVGGYGTILRSTDAGDSWSTVSTSITYSLWDLEYIDSTLYCVGSLGSLVKSTDCGMTWSVLNTEAASQLFGLCCLSANNIYVCGEGGIILHSSNGGQNWIQQAAGLNYQMNSIFFADINNGWAVGDDFHCYIYHTTNGGVNWFTQATRDNEIMHDVYFWDNGNGIAVGSYGCIFKTTNGGYPIGISSHNEPVPIYFMLHQNYPNPFNPATTIKFEIPKQSNVTLKIFDVLGREVRTLVNETLRAGTYERTWNAEGFSSGVYFYRIQTQDFAETKKMILIK